MKRMMIDLEIKKLREIQHLALIRDEEACVGAGKRGESLPVKMGGLVARLDAEALAIYKRLLHKERIFLSPLANGNCSACGMKVPTSTLFALYRTDAEWPELNRILTGCWYNVQT